jgi:aryl-alcohol dehydrogenase-like predicted oxidoreductase
MAAPLPCTTLGRTGLVVTRFGIGGAYCPSVDGYRTALDCGVTYVDTARLYRDGADEEILGRALAGRRQQLVLATKTVQRTADGARQDLEASLRALRTDWIDIYQLHHLNTAEERQQALGPGGALEAAVKAREQGLVRYLGVTGHDWLQVQPAVATGLFDTVLCWYNCAMKEPETTVFPAAQAHGTGVVIMNAGRNDRLFTPPDAPEPPQFYRYVLSHAAVHVALMGLRDVPLFVGLAAALAERASLAPAERAELEAYGDAMRSAGRLE